MKRNEITLFNKAYEYILTNSFCSYVYFLKFLNKCI